MFQAAKNAGDPQYRSSEHSISFELRGVSLIEEALPIVDLSPYIFEQFDNRTVADPQLINEVSHLLAGMKSPGRDADGYLTDIGNGNKRYQINIKPATHEDLPEIPVAEIARYMAGLAELIHTHVTPEVMMNEHSQMLTQHRLLNSTAIIQKALYNIARHQGPLTLNPANV